MKKRVSLWQWVGWRVGLIAAGAVVVMSFLMWLRFLWWDYQTQSKIPLEAREQINRMLEDPTVHEQQLWNLISHYYFIDDILPGISGSDWWTIALLLAASIPVMFVVGFLLLRPLSTGFITIAQAAQKVALGDLNVRLPVTKKMPLELERMAVDFNSMTQRLRLYEQEVQESSAVLAHELRTPLNAAMGRVRGMLDEVFPATPEQLGLVLHQLEHLNVLVNDLHLLSLAQAGQLVLEKTQFSMEVLLDERISWFKPQFDAVGRRVRVNGLDLPPVQADRNRVGQVLNILLENYLRYAAPGGDMEIDGVANQTEVSLTFSDRGPGLSEDDISRVFQRFWRQEASRARREGGSGLGLSIAQAICVAHGGSITAQRRPGSGMMFTVTLPLQHTAASRR
ncbi:Adaptive-response sensory-kinase SasA [Pseudomonas aeruginosa]|jgi:signal transduction histidine kinase|uniref:sensor histidine kinase n=1 Tax=Pseudomonas aeruginosa TaxID=287 RepID=UPI0037C9BECA|nr:HAMP domain-containing protein [Pseudomonas aeruginosa]